MYWLIEWKEWNEEIQDYETSSDIWHKWEDAIRIFNDCVQDALCHGCIVTQYTNDIPNDHDNIILSYTP